jgi:amino acid transporter
VFATILIFAIGVTLMLVLPGSALLQLIIGSSVLPALLYGGIVALYLGVRKRLGRRDGAFSLGRFELPVAVVAVIWVAFAVLALVSPPDAFVPDLIVFGLILAGALYFAKLMFFNRDVLDHEPGEDSSTSFAP